MSIEEATPADWPPGIHIYTTTRGGGVSEGSYASLNLGDHVGDDATAVTRNRRLLGDALPTGARLAWMVQVHGSDVQEVDGGEMQVPRVDAQWTRVSGLACAVMTADCLPVLMTDDGGTFVAAVHVGWRGLRDGVLQNTLRALPVEPQSLRVWTGPAIGPQAFEVGPEVREQLLVAAGDGAAFFRPSLWHEGRYLANLRGLSVRLLRDAGVRNFSAEDACTYLDAERYFSHRRDGKCGRMAHLVMRRQDP